MYVADYRGCPILRQASNRVQHLLTLVVLVGFVCIEASRPRPFHQNLETPAKVAGNTQYLHQQHGYGSAATSTVTSGAIAAATAATSSALKGRSLKQIGYDPYGYGYYDPYSAGVTPGFVNVDVNRETGLHVDVGDVAVDVSSDKNYVGLGVGKLLGIGAARDRGWNFQLGGGSVLDASVTKDAGLGLWVLDGLLNINIGPEGIFKNANPSNIAAQTTSAATPAHVTSVTVDDPAAQAAAMQAAALTSKPAGSGPGVPDVVVNDVAAPQQQQSNTEVNPPAYSTDAVEVNPVPGADNSYPNSPVAAAAAPPPPAPSPANEPQLPSYDFSMLDYHPSDIAANDSVSSHARLAAPEHQPYVAQTQPSSQAQAAYQVYSSSQAPAAAAAAAAVVPTALGQAPASYLVARPAGPTETEQDAQWSVASQYSDTQQMAAARLTAAAVSPGLGQQPSTQYLDPHPGAAPQPVTHPANPSSYWVQQQQQQPYQLQNQQPQQQRSDVAEASPEGDAGSGASRRACSGGVQVWGDGNKFKCRYKRPEPAAAVAAAEGPVKVAAGQYTYANGVAV